MAAYSCVARFQGIDKTTGNSKQSITRGTKQQCMEAAQTACISHEAWGASVYNPAGKLLMRYWYCVLAGLNYVEY